MLQGSRPQKWLDPETTILPTSWSFGLPFFVSAWISIPFFFPSLFHQAVKDSRVQQLVAKSQRMTSFQNSWAENLAQRAWASILPLNPLTSQEGESRQSMAGHSGITFAESSKWQNDSYVPCTDFLRVKLSCAIYSQGVYEGPELSLWLPALRQRTWKE